MATKRRKRHIRKSRKVRKRRYKKSRKRKLKKKYRMMQEKELPEINMNERISYNPERAVEFLNERGYIVIDFPWMTPSKLIQIKREFDTTLRQFREYKEGANEYVMGGFAALGNPSSFHNTLVRTLRMNAMAELIPLFKEYISGLEGDDWKLEQDIDRMLFRKQGKSPSRETFHRDEAINAEDSDKIFGGWINLDTHDQFFSCVPGTHTEVQGHSGFSLIKDQSQIERYKKDKQKIKIPPGSIMIFYENLVHEVLSSKAKRDMYRLFTGWRITQSNESLIGNEKLRKLLDDNAIIPLKSGQEPPIYAKLHWTNWMPKLTSFSDENISDAFTEMKLRKKEKKEYRVSQRFMKSLREAGQPLYDEYDEIEYNMYIPNKNWILQYGGDDKLYKYNLNFHIIL